MSLVNIAVRFSEEITSLNFLRETTMRRVVSPITRRWALPAAMALAFVALAASAPCSGKTPPAFAITHVAVIDVGSGTTLPDRTVVIREGRIISVEKSTDTVPDGAEIVEGRNRFLMPGLWDMHVHLSYARASALPALVANGVTGVRDMGSDLAEIDEWRSQIADHTLIGPTIFRAGPMINGKEFNQYQLAVTSSVEARTAVRTLRKVGVDFIKLHRQTPGEAYFSIAEECKKLGIPFVGHVPMSVSPAEASDAGQASIEHTITLFEGTFSAAHAKNDLAVWISRWRTMEAQALFATFVRNGTFVDPTLIAQEYLSRLYQAGRPDPHARYIAASARKEAEKLLRPETKQFVLENQPVLRELRAVTRLMSEAGVALLAGSDLSFLHPPGFSLHDELALLVKSGLSPQDALRAATLNPARLFKLDDTGVISPDARADLILLDANPLEDIRNTQRINAVMLRGTLFNRQDLDRLLIRTAWLAEHN